MVIGHGYTPAVTPVLPRWHPSKRDPIRQVCDSEQPLRDGSYRAEGPARARDAVQSWRQRVNKQKDRGGEVAIRYNGSSWIND